MRAENGVIRQELRKLEEQQKTILQFMDELLDDCTAIAPVAQAAPAPAAQATMPPKPATPTTQPPQIDSDARVSPVRRSGRNLTPPD
jgi:hypothetical protein